jgi:hypothetical protein
MRVGATKQKSGDRVRQPAYTEVPEPRGANAKVQPHAAPTQVCETAGGLDRSLMLRLASCHQTWEKGTVLIRGQLFQYVPGITPNKPPCNNITLNRTSRFSND